MAIDPFEFEPGFAAPQPKSMSSDMRLERENSDLLDVMAWTMLGEAANQGKDGLAAIAHVGLNRANSGRYPSDLKSVFLQPKQFSTWNSGQGGNDPKSRYPKSGDAFKEARQIAKEVLAGRLADPTGGATHYWAPKGMTAMGYAEDPYWASSEEGPAGRLTLGDHVFLPRGPVPPMGMPSDPPIPADRTRVAELRQDFAAKHMPTPAPLSQRQAAADRFEQRYRAPLPMPTPLNLPIERSSVAGRFDGSVAQPRLNANGPTAAQGNLTPMNLPGARSVASIPMGPGGFDLTRNYDPTVPAATMGLPPRQTSAPGAGVTPQQRTAMAALPRAPAPLPAPGAGLSPDQRNAMAAVPRAPTPLPALSAPGAGLSPAQRAAMSAVPSQPKTVSPSFAQSFASAVNAPKANPAVTRTVPLAGQTQMPRDVRPAVLNTPQMAMPMPTLSQRAPIPATMSPQMAASRFPSALAPMPATMSPQLASQRYLSSLAPMPASVAARDLARSRGAQSGSGVIQAGSYSYTKGPNGYVRVGSSGGSSSGGGAMSYSEWARSGGGDGGYEGNSFGSLV